MPFTKTAREFAERAPLDHERAGGYQCEISSSYATGSVSAGSGSSGIGGLVGYMVSGAVTSSYWNQTTSGQSSGVGNGTYNGVFGLTNAQAKLQSSYSGWDFTNTWYMGANGYPALTALAGDILKITVNNSTMTYGGLLPSFTYSYSGLASGDTISVLSGLSLSTQATTASSVGNYAITASGGSATSATGQTYTIVYNAGLLTISPKPLIISANSVSATYGTAATLSSSAFTTSGLVNGDSVSALTETSTGNTATAVVGSYAITASSATGSGLGNYTITYVPGTLTVNAKPLTWSVANATSTYGTTPVPGLASLSGVVGSDAVSGVVSLTNSVNGAVTPAATTGAGSYTEKVTALSGAAAADYILAGSGDSAGTLVISPKALTWSVSNSAATVGTAASVGKATLTGILSSDTVIAQVTVYNGATAIVPGATTAAGSYGEKVTSLTGASASDYILSSTGDSIGTLNIAAIPVPPTPTIVLLQPLLTPLELETRH